MPEQIDPSLWERPDVQPVLSGRDVGALYRMPKDDAGLVQRKIAALTGQTQSEVSEVLRGRQVIAYEVLERIATGLGIPGNGWDCPGGARTESGTALRQRSNGCWLCQAQS